jgi:hypothetical protein
VLVRYVIASYEMLLAQVFDCGKIGNVTALTCKGLIVRDRVVADNRPAPLLTTLQPIRIHERFAYD